MTESCSCPSNPASHSSFLRWVGIVSLPLPLLLAACGGGDSESAGVDQESSSGGQDAADGSGPSGSSGGDTPGSTRGPSGGSNGSADTSGGPDSGDTDPTEVPETCENGVEDPGEEGVDCGGACPSCLGVAFESEWVEWPVPDLRFYNPTDLTLRWQAIDMDGDGRTDLVESRSGTATAFGGASDPHWRVYFNEGDGFASSATPWPVPAVEIWTANDPNRTWASLDLDGDGRVDLVRTWADTGMVYGGARNPHWEVYFNDGAGFASSATEWPVPDVRFRSTTETQIIQWSSFDLDGDGKVDLVQTGDATPSAYGGDRDPHWRPLINGGDGFAVEPTRWPVPDVEIAMPNAIGSRVWSTVDIDGDGRVDLAQTGSNPASAYGGEGDPHWRVHLGDGGGFAVQASEWSVPAAKFGSLALPTLDWTSLDLDGDGALDLVETRLAPDMAFGGESDPHWRVYFNEGSGFADAATPWSIPAVEFWTPTDPNFGWVALDIDGDGRTDLVETRAPGSASVAFGDDGDPHWRVYFNISS